MRKSSHAAHGEKVELTDSGTDLMQFYAVEVEQKHGKLTAAQMLRCRVRYFVDGAAIGSRSFVEEVLASCRERLHSKRKVGASRMKGADFGGLCSLRDLKVRVIVQS